MAHGLQGFPQSSYYGKSKKNGSAPAPKAAPKKMSTFEDEYQKFIRELKAKKEAQKQAEEQPYALYFIHFSAWPSPFSFTGITMKMAGACCGSMMELISTFRPFHMSATSRSLSFTVTLT